jgi:hypothetical protein
VIANHSPVFAISPKYRKRVSTSGSQGKIDSWPILQSLFDESISSTLYFVFCEGFKIIKDLTSPVTRPLNKASHKRVPAAWSRGATPAGVKIALVSIRELASCRIEKFGSNSLLQVDDSQLTHTLPEVVLHVLQIYS